MRYATKSGYCIEAAQMFSLHGSTGGRGGAEPRLIVVHAAETAKVSQAAEALGGWLEGPLAPKAGWHFAVDDDSVTQSVRLEDTAWHAGAVNRYSIGIEHAGRARQTAADWGDPYSCRMLDLSAMLVAALCERYGIPVTRPSVTEIAEGHRKGGARGIVGHWDVTQALGGSHWDPGPAFPWQAYLERVRRVLAGGVL